jgi:hypothetical protein
MPLMTVDNQETGDFPPNPLWSAGRKMDVVLRLLCREKTDELSRELYEDLDDLRQAVATFATLYNTECLIERLGHRSPRDVPGLVT